MADIAYALKDKLRIHNTRRFTSSGNVTMLNEGVLIVDKSTGAATTVTLPSDPSNGDCIIIIDGKGDASSNPITLATPDSETVGGLASTKRVIASDRGWLMLTYDSTDSDWRVDGEGNSSGGTLTSVSGLSLAEVSSGGINHSVFIFDGVTISTTDNGTAGHAGSQKIFDFPQGGILVLGASQNWETLTVDGTGLPNDAEMDIGLGTTAATSAMASLTTTTQDIVNKDDITMSSSLSATHQYIATVSGGNLLAGEATAKDAYLNIAATVATADADGTVTLTGTVTVAWINLGKQSS